MIVAITTITNETRPCIGPLNKTLLPNEILIASNITSFELNSMPQVDNPRRILAPTPGFSLK